MRGAVAGRHPPPGGLSTRIVDLQPAPVAAASSTRVAAASDPPARRWWRRWGWLLRWAGTGLGVAYLIAVVDVDSLASALARTSIATALVALAVISSSLVVGAVRWRALMTAYGAIALPSLATAVRLYFVAGFYNTYLPGGVAGDVVRGVVVRDSFRDRGTTEALAVVFVERVLGLLGVFALAAIGLVLVGPRLATTSVWWWWSAAGAGVSLIAVLMLPLGRRLAPYLPRRLAAIAARLPVVSRRGYFAAAALLSLATQLLTAVTGWLFLREVHPAATLSDALVIVPLAAATAALPITVAGLGAREAVFVQLCSKLLGMSAGDGLAASLLIWATTLMTGVFGGILQLVRPLSQPAPSDPR
jgi:glycosyltransferase 2 family protein